MLGSKPFLLVFLLLSAFSSGDHPTEEMEKILPPATQQRYLTSDYPDKMKIVRTAIQNTFTRLRIHANRGEQEELLARLEDIETLGKEGLARSLETTDEGDLRDKEVKRLEIELRKTIALLEDLKLEVAFEMRKFFYPAINSLDELRQQLFMQLFEGARSFETELGRGGLAFAGGVMMLRKAAYLLPAQGLNDLDRFTKEEFRSIQVARSVDDRVEAIMEIAESRLDEIDRRRKGEEWEEDEPNPLEFYTYDDLLHAYNRALEAAMHSIDDDYERGFSRMDEIESALDELNDRSSDFQPRLIDLEPLIKEIRSFELAEKLSKAQEYTEMAIKGAKSGLESIEKRKD